MRIGHRRALASLTAAAVVLTLLSACTRPAARAPAAAGGAVTVQALQKGPDPTEASITAARGPFAIATAQAPRGNGFGGGTIYYPTDDSQGTYGAIVVVPGFISGQSSIQWYGPRIASQGFVVLTIDTNTPLDFPGPRSTQQQAALRYLTTTSTVANRIDPTRLGAMGWSMGGGGSLQTAAQNPNIKAAIPLAPWNLSVFRPTAPTMIVACQNDAVAGNASHTNRFYPAIQGEKALLEVRGGGHFCVTTASAMIAKHSIAWLKRFIDEDTRYSPFICTAAPSGASRYLNTCPV